ncbi:DUF1835 domain-containing protein [Bacillus salipaludis]|uniref:DUF1835 domain-containing protein n=1 Tax=Bacillus salipaludis TaxID=2547811 RepID=A0A4R5VSN1_9BACI|nr:DUF1835 domain-containing protein [Bacillus salipaludis]TDK61779.1 DUF1835 domain-containing protein [Bacillus salipaludis]
MELEILKKVIKELPEGNVRSLLFHILQRVQFLDEMEYSEEKFVKDMKEVYRMIFDLSREKSEAKMEEPFKTVHILFGISAAGTFKMVLKEMGDYNTEKVISFWDMFSLGPIMQLHHENGKEARFDWMKNIIPNEYGEFEEYKQKFQEVINQIISIPEGASIIVWVSENAHEQTGLRFVLHLLKESNNDVSIINTTKVYNELFQKRKVKYTVLHSGEIPNEKFKKIYEQSKTEPPLTQHEREDYGREWLLLSENQETLRIWRNGKIQCVPENYFDEFIIGRAKKLHGKRNNKEFIKSVRLIGEVLGHLDQFIDDSFLEYRLKKLIEMGCFEAEGSLKAMRLYSVRLKTEEMIEYEPKSY